MCVTMERHQKRCVFLPILLISSQDLLLNLELTYSFQTMWQLASHSNPPVSVLLSASVTSPCWTCLACDMGAGIPTPGLILAQSSPITHLQPLYLTLYSLIEFQAVKWLKEPPAGSWSYLVLPSWKVTLTTDLRTMEWTLENCFLASHQPIYGSCVYEHIHT